MRVPAVQDHQPKRPRIIDQPRINSRGQVDAGKLAAAGFTTEQLIELRIHVSRVEVFGELGGQAVQRRCAAEPVDFPIAMEIRGTFRQFPHRVAEDVDGIAGLGAQEPKPRSGHARRRRISQWRGCHEHGARRPGHRSAEAKTAALRFDGLRPCGIALHFGVEHGCIMRVQRFQHGGAHARLAQRDRTRQDQRGCVFGMPQRCDHVRHQPQRATSLLEPFVDPGRPDFSKQTEQLRVHRIGTRHDVPIAVLPRFGRERTVIEAVEIGERFHGDVAFTPCVRIQLLEQSATHDFILLMGLRRQPGRLKAAEDLLQPMACPDAPFAACFRIRFDQ